MAGRVGDVADRGDIRHVVRAYTNGRVHEAAGVGCIRQGVKGVGFAVCSAVVLAVFSTTTLPPNPATCSM